MLCVFEKTFRNDEFFCRTCGAKAKSRKMPVYRVCKLPNPAGTAGTNLKKLLSTIGLHANGNCKCNSRAMHMNAMGNDWCEENIDTIVGWLAEEAASRGLPFLNAVGRLLVKRAIHNARKATPH